MKNRSLNILVLMLSSEQKYFPKMKLSDVSSVFFAPKVETVYEGATREKEKGQL